MVVAVKMQDLVDALDFPSDEMYGFLDKKTGEVVVLTDEEFRAAEGNESLDDFPEWQHDAIALAKSVLDNPENYLELPSKYDINEYGIIQDFCLLVADERLREQLLDSIRGRGAFRRFKDGVHRQGIADDWYRYRDDALKRIAVEWCEINEIEFVDD